LLINPTRIPGELPDVFFPVWLCSAAIYGRFCQGVAALPGVFRPFPQSGDEPPHSKSRTAAFFSRPATCQTLEIDL
jgi:hypothetical protein